MDIDSRDPLVHDLHEAPPETRPYNSDVQLRRRVARGTRDQITKLTSALAGGNPEFLADAGIATVLTGVRILRLNSLMERWIQTCRHELLDRTLIHNQAHLMHALREYETHYNSHRPHRGIAGAAPLRPLPQPIDPGSVTPPRIDRHDRLGGLLHEYRYAA